MPNTPATPPRAPNTGRPVTQLEALPLYRQVKRTLVGRLANGHWPPGTMLPSEMALAGELGVSQGTVRKALDEMAAENIVVRRQGRGTFAAELDDARILFHFFKLTADDGLRRYPESTVTGVNRAAPTAEERKALALTGNARVIRIARLRHLDGQPVIAETISIAARTFPDLDRLGTIPNNLYALYASRYGRTIAHADEDLTAINADATTAARLRVSNGAALLRVARTAYAVDGSAVEYRVSLCRTDGLHYEVSLR
ncbi:MAG: GntR family transcriptional regulator [Pseudomonadota bacterium]